MRASRTPNQLYALVAMSSTMDPSAEGIPTPIGFVPKMALELPAGATNSGDCAMQIAIMPSSATFLQ